MKGSVLYKMNMENVSVIKKDGTRETFQAQKIINAVEKSAYRALTPLTDKDKEGILAYVQEYISNYQREEITVPQMHNLVESALEHTKPEVAKSYRDYRNYKTDFVEMINSVYKKAQSIMYIGDKENSNTDSALVSTKRSLIYSQLNKELYQKFFMTTSELQACRDGYIYVHDMASRRDTMNCCLCDVKTILEGGFEMGNLWYNEPKTLDTAFDVIGDIVLSAASQQYGGFTIARVDEILSKYAQKSYEKYCNELYNLCYDISGQSRGDALTLEQRQNVQEKAREKVYRDMEQGFQGWEYKFNTVSSSRGDYPFTTITIGLGTDEWAKMATTVCLRVRATGQGAPGHKRPVLFPKVVFTYTEDLHGSGAPNEDLYWEGIKCSSKAMYPDWLSLDGNTTVSEMYHKYGEAVAPMGCVDGDEVVTYEIGEQLFVEGIRSMWDRLAVKNEIKQQIPELPHGYMDVDDVYIYDKECGFVPVRRMVKNLTSRWLLLTLSNGMKFKCTLDHPLPVIDRGRVAASNLNVGDRLSLSLSQRISDKTTITLRDILVIKKDTSFRNGGLYGEIPSNIMDCDTASIVSIDTIKETDYSYDVTTDSDHFDVSGIYSHNCRAFLSPYYERGGFEPADDNDKPVFTGRWNAGVVSLHLPMILAKARQENKDFYEVLDYYLEMIRNLHKRTKEYLGELRASVNPLQCCEGGFYKGHLKPHDKIKPLLDYVTFSYGITALNELNRLYNGKSIYEDGQFPLEVMEYINKKIAEYKNEDHILYAIYGTPAESLCFDGDTYVQVYGDSKKIRDIQPGDLVYSYNEETHNIEIKKVIWSKRTHRAAKVMMITFSNKENIICTPNHPFACKTMNDDGIEHIVWIEAKDLKDGDRVKASFIHNQTQIEQECKVVTSEYLTERHEVYNIEVEGNHNFFIGNGGTNILVHNCGTQIEQFRKMYGVIENVSDREYVSNSFHCHVTEDINPIEKQDSENRFWNLFGGGRIQYVKYPIGYNLDAISTLVRRAMKMGDYEGINLDLSYCAQCGHEELEMGDKCPKCGSDDLVKINRMNGYLSYSRIHGNSTLNDAKMAEIEDRKSM